jgi:hypothetical protein
MVYERKTELVIDVIKVNIYLALPWKETGLTKPAVRAHIAWKLR